MEILMELRGLEQSINNVARFGDKAIAQVYGKGTLAAARVVVPPAKARVRVKTGRLKRSIRAKLRKALVTTSAGPRRIPKAGARVYAGAKGARQGYIIETGRRPNPPKTSRAPAYPYLVPALRLTLSQQFPAAIRAMRLAYADLARKFSARSETLN